MSYAISFNPLSLAGVFRLRNVKVFEWEGDIVLVVDEGGRSRLLHLFENEVDGDTMFGLNLGQSANLVGQPFFVGNPCAVELSLAKSENDWDFKSLQLKDDSGSLLRVGRNDASFPEPTFALIRDSQLR